MSTKVRWRPRLWLLILPSFYVYLFHKGNPHKWSKWTWRKVWCRLCDHPCGYVYYNPGGLEPDYTCKNCGDEI